jgi:tRNA (guanine37-N1)-methyltransferase
VSESSPLPAAPFRVDVITLFPRMIDVPLAESILGKAQQRGLLQVIARDLRPYGEGKHRLTDDTPYGGGAGMVMKPEPLVKAIEEARAQAAPGTRVILLDPQGVRFDQAAAARLSQTPGLIFVCGRYEGVDERVRPYVDEALSMGDFVLTGGEFAALCVIDAVVRLRPGVLGNETSTAEESFAQGLLEGPQYTRPLDFRGERVPDILLSGHHADVRRWRRRQALARTLAVRPEILAALPLTKEDQTTLRDLRAARNQGIAADPSERDLRPSTGE